MNQKYWPDIIGIMGAIANSIRNYYNDADSRPSKDVAISAIQVFSLILSKECGYSKEDIEAMWKTSKDIYTTLSNARYDENINMPTNKENN